MVVNWMDFTYGGLSHYPQAGLFSPKRRLLEVLCEILVLKLLVVSRLVDRVIQILLMLKNSASCWLSTLLLNNCVVAELHGHPKLEILAAILKALIKVFVGTLDIIDDSF